MVLTRILRIFALALLLFLTGIRSAHAQNGSAYLGFGTAIDSSIGPINTLGAGVIYNSPRMGGLFDTIGGDVVFFHHNVLGLGAEVSFRNGKGPYAGLDYRPLFYDLNAVYQPRPSSRRFTPEIQAGLGRANLHFYYTPQFCSVSPQGCASAYAKAPGANYLQAHFAGGLRYYVYKDLFIRPQVDLRWVNNLAYFGSSWVPEFTVAVGYTIRRKSK